jgi:hypothetical protein
MARLAQISIRFEHVAISQARFEELGHEIDRAAAEVARRIYGDDVVELDVYVQAGSLFLRLTVIGGLLLGTYHAVAEYKDFRESLSLLSEDAGHFGEQISKEVSKLMGGAKADSVRSRKMTPSKILKVIEELETVQKAGETLPENVVHDRVEKIIRDIRAIERDLTPEESKRFSGQLEERGLRVLTEVPKRKPATGEEEEPAADRERERVLRDESVGKRERRPAGAGEKRLVLRYHNRFRVGKPR